MQYYVVTLSSAAARFYQSVKALHLSCWHALQEAASSALLALLSSRPGVFLLDRLPLLGFFSAGLAATAITGSCSCS